MNYSKFTHLQNQAGIVINRKILAELAVYEPYSFKSIVDVAKAYDQSDLQLINGSVKQSLLLEQINMSRLQISDTPGSELEPAHEPEEARENAQQ